MIITMQVLVLILVSILNILLGAMVYVSNPKRDPNRLFFALTIVFSLWTFSNYWTTNNGDVELIYPVRLTIFLACFISIFVWFAIKTFPNNSIKSIRFYKLQLSFVTLVSSLTLTPLVFKDVAIIEGASKTEVGPLVPLFGLVAVGFVGGSVLSIIRKYLRSSGVLRKQTLIVLLGIGMTFLAILITNFILVLMFETSLFLSYTPAFSLIFSSAFAYGILRHQMYEFRTLVTKAVSYIISLSVLIVIPSFVAIYIINHLPSSSNDNVRIILTTAIFVILISVYNPLKGLFNKITAKVFFRDSYDTQKVISALIEFLNTTNNLNEIINKSLASLQDSISPSRIAFVVLKDGVIYESSNSGNEYSKQEIVDGLAVHKKSILVASLQGAGEIKNFLNYHDIEIASKIKAENELVGYLLIGNKKSGSIYSNQDIELVNLFSKEVALALQNARKFEEIQRFNITLQEKIDKATKELREKNAKLKELDEAKDDFISMASHQLRTPLTTMKGMVSMVIEGDAGKINAKQKEFLTEAFNSSQRMVYLITDILNVSRLKTGKFIIEPTEVDLSSMIKSEIRQLTETAKHKGLNLNYTPPKGFPLVMLDDNKIRQVIMNFIDNAIYYTPKGGEIDVMLESTSQSITFKVVDNGIGVPKAAQHKLFTKFYRAGNAQKRRPDGTGLGLFMAKKVIVAQEGALLFKSTEGKGSTFGFSFPLHKVGLKKSAKKSS